MKDFSALERWTEHAFSDPALLRRALVRRAYAEEEGLFPSAHMDALATLGDAVIGCLVVEALVRRGGVDKGEISKEKMQRVNMTVLRRAAEEIDLQKYVSWGRGEEAQEVWTSGRVLAECFEALSGALFLDGGLDAALPLLAGTGVLPEE